MQERAEELKIYKKNLYNLNERVELFVISRGFEESTVVLLLFQMCRDSHIKIRRVRSSEN